MRVRWLGWGLAAVCLGFSGPAGGQELPAETRAKVDAAIRRVVAASGVPSASVGIARGGRVVFAQAYGDARLKPELKATAAMGYPVGSITKQFTATCILLLQEDGKLTLDDKVSRWYPELTRAGDVTLRELLSHTSGYEDYAPQDYTIPLWMRPGDPEKLVREWAGKPLDFEPGTEWQYSNTNFVLAALIVQKASGMPFFDFLRKRVLEPVGMRDVLNLDTDRDRVEVQGYERRALAPLRPAVLEAPGWYFGDGNLSMPVAELLRWDMAVMNRTLLTAKSYDEFETDVTLKSGAATGYGLGISVMHEKGRLILEHSGEVGGFVAENMVLPGDKLAIAVLTNQEASSAAGEIAGVIAKLLMGPAAAVAAPAGMLPEEAQVRTILAGLEDGAIDRKLFTEDANYYFSAETLGDFSSSLKPLGTVTAVKKKEESLRGGMVYRSFTAVFSGGAKVAISTYTMPDGRLEQMLVEGKE